MRKLLGFLSLALLVGGLAGKAEAAAGVRGGKNNVTIYNTTGLIGVSSGTATLYAVTLGTGTAGTDYVVLFDSASVTGITSTIQNQAAYRARLHVSSTTQNTFYVFDPPLIFTNGIIAATSAGTLTATITFERGRAVTGY